MDNLFIVSGIPQDLAGRRLAIWGFGDEAHWIFSETLKQGVHVDCFVDDTGRPELRGLRYLNKPLLAPEEFAAKCEGHTVLVSSTDEPAARACCPSARIFTVAELNPKLRQAAEVVIYGTAVLGGAARATLARCGVNVVTFADSFADIRGGYIRRVCPSSRRRRWRRSIPGPWWSSPASTSPKSPPPCAGAGLATSGCMPTTTQRQAHLPSPSKATPSNGVLVMCGE